MTDTFLHSDRSLLQTVRVFFRIFQIVLKVFLFPIWSVLPSFSTSETSVLYLEKFVYEARIDGYEVDISNSEKIILSQFLNLFGLISFGVIANILIKFNATNVQRIIFSFSIVLFHSYFVLFEITLSVEVPGSLSSF